MAPDHPCRDDTDIERIHIEEDSALRDWSTRFGVTPQLLKAAVLAVGDRADAVAEILRASAGTPR